MLKAIRRARGICRIAEQLVLINSAKLVSRRQTLQQNELVPRLLDSQRPILSFLD
jgi:hypothetical protein